MVQLFILMSLELEFYPYWVRWEQMLTNIVVQKFFRFCNSLLFPFKERIV